MQAHTHRRTHCRCCCWFHLYVSVYLGQTHRSPSSCLQVRFRISRQLFDLCHWRLFAGKGAWEWMPSKKRLDSVCHRCQLFRLFAINKYVSFRNQINTHCRDCQCQFMGKIKLHKTVEIFLGLNVNFSTTLCPGLQNLDIITFMANMNTRVQQWLNRKSIEIIYAINVRFSSLKYTLCILNEN